MRAKKDMMKSSFFIVQDTKTRLNGGGVETELVNFYKDLHINIQG